MEFKKGDHTPLVLDEKNVLRDRHQWNWKEVQGVFYPGPSSTVVPKSFQYLQTSHKRLAFIPSSLVGLSASVFHEGDTTYVTGMDFICTDSLVISAGYRLSPGSRQFIWE